MFVANNVKHIVNALCIFAFPFICYSDISQENFQKYLDFIEFPKTQSLSPSEDCLHEIVSRHVYHIAYQNQTIFNHQMPDLNNDHLCSKLLDKQEGGMCYETSELLYEVLNHIGFSPKRVPAFPLNGKPWNPLIPSSHNVIIVDLNKNLYLIDVGYGNNSIRYPICFNFKETEEKEIFPGEEYQLICLDDHYQLNLKINGKFCSLYRFNRPFETINIQQTLENMDCLLKNDGFIPIRDLYLKASKLTPFGRLSFYAEPLNGIASAYFAEEKNGKRIKTTYNSWDDFLKDISKYLNVDFSQTIHALSL